MKIKAVLINFISNPDRAGNSYYAFRWIDTATGKVVGGRTGMSNNISWITKEMGLGWDECTYIEVCLPIRKWNQTVPVQFAGNHQKDLAAFINKKLNES